MDCHGITIFHLVALQGSRKGCAFIQPVIEQCENGIPTASSRVMKRHSLVVNNLVLLGKPLVVKTTIAHVLVLNELPDLASIFLGIIVERDVDPRICPFHGLEKRSRHFMKSRAVRRQDNIAPMPVEQVNDLNDVRVNGGFAAHNENLLRFDQVRPFLAGFFNLAERDDPFEVRYEMRAIRAFLIAVVNHGEFESVRQDDFVGHALASFGYLKNILELVSSTNHCARFE